MAAELIAELGIFKSMLDMANELKDIGDAAVRNAAVIELQEKIIAAQMQQAALIERVVELENRVARFKTWETEKQRYELKVLPPGVHVYALKPDMASGEPLHQICQTCYQHGKKSILHQTETHNGIYHLKCNECGADLKVGHFQAPRVHRGKGGSDSWIA